MCISPVLFEKKDVFQGPYAARIQEFVKAGLSAGLSPAYKDTEKIAVVLVDYQHDFVDPTGSLFVPGAREDMGRFLDWFYANAHRITSIYASLDTHVPLQIFFSSWWRNPQTGEHPAPFTAITVDDINAMRWMPVLEPNWSLHYVRQLKEQASKDLMIWPYHTMEGTLGHMLAAPISEAIAWHSAARKTQPIYVVKGKTIRTEYYGMFGAEVVDPEDPESQVNTALLDAVLTHDKVYVAGEAKSHCVLETVRQLVSHSGQQPEILKRLHILRDCTSSVEHQAIDFDRLSEEALAGMEQQGVRMVLSSEPVRA